MAGLEMRAAANHWKLAIETHNTNHPLVDHYLTNLSQADPRYFPDTNFLLASPECTNHSLAKGRRRKSAQLSMLDPTKIDPSEERSRATMWCVPRFAEYHSYDLIIVENVVDVVHWILFNDWLGAMKTLGYSHHICYFNSMFFSPINGLQD
ncbi:MAG: DNA cytosine methyltransferase, partial [Nitrospiria bacterium]